MWIFTEAADWFDRKRLANNRFLDQTFTGWVDYALRHADEPGYWPALRNGMIYSGTGLLYALNQLTTTVASGFVDTLRIGDGVQRGGWGYAQDALRLLGVIGPFAKPLNALLKVGRGALADLVAVDPAANAPICTWVAAAKALVMTGTRHFATVRQIEEAFGWPGIARELHVSVFLGTVLRTLQRMGARATTAGEFLRASSQATVEGALTELLEAHPDTIAPFSVTWEAEGAGINEFADVEEGDPVGHTMIAFRNIAGELRILDRTGAIVRSLEELDPAYPGIRNGLFYAVDNVIIDDTAVLVHHASIVPLLRTGQTLGAVLQSALTPFRAPDGTLFTDASWIRDALGLEIRSVPMRTEPRRVVNVPLRVAPSSGPIRTQTFCLPALRSSDAAGAVGTEQCSVLRTYVVQVGDTLATIAQYVYGDAEQWRMIAHVNGIVNASKLRAGTVVVIP